jgi:hypothetical protein
VERVADLLSEHVTLRLDSVDRIGVHGYIQGLAYEGGLVRFLLGRGYRLPTPRGLAQNHDRLVAELEQFAVAAGLDVVRFAKGQCKEDAARPCQQAAARAGMPGVVFIGKAQERISAWAGHTQSRPGHRVHIAYSRQSRVPDHWYFYLWDNEWGPVLVKLCPFAPYPLWINANGHEWAKRQLAKAGVGFTELDNGLRAVDDPRLASAICARLGAGHLRAGIGRWLSWLPSPLLPGDLRGGFRYDFAVRQLEVSETLVFDRPQSGRAWFESAIRNHLDLGRPAEVSLIVDRRVVSRARRPTPGRFETRVITADVDPEIRIRYKSDKVKAYFKERRALRVETTINNPRDFGIGTTLCAENWRALRRVGSQTNTRFLAALADAEYIAPDPATLHAVVLPSTADDGLRAPGLRFGDPRVMALLAATAHFTHLAGGLTNAGLRRLMRGLYAPGYSARQASYDLRRLKRKGFIERVPGTHTYQVTSYGRQIACFLTKLAARVVVPVLTELDVAARPEPPAPRPVLQAWRAYERRLDEFLISVQVAA